MNTAVIADLTPGSAVGVKPCIPTTELRAGDTLYAKGFRRGASRKVLEVSIRGGVAYIRVKEGWYRWTRVYCNVAAL